MASPLADAPVVPVSFVTKALLLDIDGVLNSAEYVRLRRPNPRPPGHLNLDAPAIARLNAVTDRTGASIVVSSNWRLWKTVEELAEPLRRYGVTGQIVDKTPSYYGRYSDHPEDDTRVVIARERGHEIQAWLDAHPECARFAIVDDRDDMAHLAHRLVLTDEETGLQDAHVEALVAMLGELALPFATIYSLCAAGRTDDALDMLCEITDELMCDGRFEELDDALACADLSRLAEDEIVGLLTFTFPGRHRLPSRDGLRERAKEHLRGTMSESELEELFGVLS